MARTSYRRFDQIIKITRFMARICGADFVNPNYKMGVITWIIIIAINLFYACTIYTMYRRLVIEGDWKAVLETLCLVGGAVQGYSKLLSGIFRPTVVVDISDLLYGVYEEYEQKGVAYEKVLNNCTDLTWKILKIVLCIYIFVIGTIILYPLIYWFLHGEKMFVMQFLIPGIDPHTEYGYITHVVCQVCLMAWGGFGNFASDMFIFTCIINITLLRDILQVKFEKLNEIVLRTHDPKITMPLLRDILEWHQNYNKYVIQIESFYYVIIFIQIFAAVVSICCTIFSMILGSWPAAFAYLTYSVSSMYSFCGLGNLVENSNDGFTTTIYTDCLWYELTVPEQKLILLMLRKSQQQITLSIGQIMPLSLKTALQLTKCIYSYTMMLLNFLEVEEN